MFFIPGWLISVLTFPGVIAHELAHKFFCDLARVPVYEVKYFQFGNPAGYVIHAHPQDLRSSFLISVGPLLVNTALCSLLTLAAAFPFFILDVKDPNPVFSLLMWVGISIGMHAFPSNEDMANFKASVVNAKGSGIALLFARFLSGIFALANALRIIWFDAIYAVGVSMAMPLLVLHVLAGASK